VLEPWRGWVRHPELKCPPRFDNGAIRPCVWEEHARRIGPPAVALRMSKSSATDVNLPGGPTGPSTSTQRWTGHRDAARSGHACTSYPVAIPNGAFDWTELPDAIRCRDNTAFCVSL
jgi:hypothetical protein